MSSCKKCGYENSEGYKFCPICGEKCETTKICVNCSTEVPEDYVFCPSCGNKCDGKKVCSNCQFELEPQHDFCPSCGFSVNTKHEPVKEEKQPKAKKAKTQLGFLPIFNLCSKIVVAVMCFISLLVFSFGPIHKAEFFEFGIPIEATYTGIQVIDYSIKGLQNIDEEEMYDIFEEKTEDILDEYNAEDVYDLSRSELKEAIKKFPILFPALYDGENSYDSPNTTLVIQLTVNAVVFIGIEVLLILGTIFSILAIFKKDYSYKKLIKLFVIPAGLILLFAGALKIMGISIPYLYVSSTSLAKGAISTLILLLISAAVVYVYEVFNKNINFNLKKVISKSVALVVVVISIFVIGGTFSKVSYKNSDDRTNEFEYSLHNTVFSFEVGMNNADYKRDYGYHFISSEEELEEWYDFSKKEATRYGEYAMARLFVSDDIFNDTLAPEFALISYALYVGGSVLLSLAFICILNSFFNNKHKVKEIVPIIIAIALNMLFVWFVIKKVNLVEKLLGKGGIYILRKFFGVILLAMSVKLIISNLIPLIS